MHKAKAAAELTEGSIAMHYIIVALKLLLTKIYETDGIPWHIVQRFVIKTLTVISPLEGAF